MLNRTRSALSAIAFAALLLATIGSVQAQAQSHAADSVAFVVNRQPLRHAAFAIVTTDGTSALLLTDSTIVAQLTDAGLDHVGRDVERSMRNDTSVALMARMLGGALAGALRPLLDHGVAYRLTDLGEARSSGGRLELLRRNGEPVFNHMEMNGREILDSFSPQDARDFARRAQDAAKRLRDTGRSKQ